MKLFSKTTNKWLLSTMMVAALGSQYYFSVSSNTFGNYELSSTATEELAEKLKQLDNTREATPAEIEKRKKDLIESYSSKIKAENAEKDKKAADGKVELIVAQNTAGSVTKDTAETDAAGTYEIQCDICGENKFIVLSKINFDTAIYLAKQLRKPETLVTKRVSKDEEEVVAETAKERRERLKEEREEQKRITREAKEEKKQAKLDKLLEEKEERNDAFTDKAEEIAERCQEDLSCKVSQFTSLIKRYSGSKKVDQSIVNKAYNTLIDKDLKAGLRSTDKTDALNALESLMGENLPAEYKDLKKRAVIATKTAQADQVESINSLYKQADIYKANKQTTQELEARGLALAASDNFRSESAAIYQSLYNSTLSAGDKTTLDYVVNTYAPEMRNILARLSNPTATYSTVTNASIGNGPIGGAATGNRGGRTGNTTGVNINNGGAVINSNSSNGLSGVNFGTPTQNRTTNRTGVKLQ